MLEMIRENEETLTSLHLDGKNIGIARTQTLATALLENHTVTELFLGSNYIGDEGAQALATMLRGNRTITTLWLNHNHIGTEGAKALASALLENHTIIELVLSYNNIGDEGANAIAAAVESSLSAIRSLNFYGNIDFSTGTNHRITALLSSTGLQTRQNNFAVHINAVSREIQFWNKAKYGSLSKETPRLICGNKTPQIFFTLLMGIRHLSEQNPPLCKVDPACIEEALDSITVADFCGIVDCEAQVE